MKGITILSKYEIDEFSNITNTQGKILKLTTHCQTGRFQISLYCDDGLRRSFYVHRLVAMAFIPNPENKPEINHIDGNPKNNSIDNLEWCDRFENMKHANLIGLYPRKRGSDHHNHIDEWTANNKKEYIRAFDRAKVRGLNWKSLTTEQRKALLTMPKLSKWDTLKMRSHG